MSDQIELDLRKNITKFNDLIIEKEEQIEVKLKDDNKEEKLTKG